jgi:hypothetical protein
VRVHEPVLRGGGAGAGLAGVAGPWVFVAGFGYVFYLAGQFFAADEALAAAEQEGRRLDELRRIGIEQIREREREERRRQRRCSVRHPLWPRCTRGPSTPVTAVYAYRDPMRPNQVGSLD